MSQPTHPATMCMYTCTHIFGLASYTETWNDLEIKFIFLSLMAPNPPAGPLGLARGILESDSEPFFVLNSDVICNYPFKKMLDLHKSHGKEGTIVVSGMYIVTVCVYCIKIHVHELYINCTCTCIMRHVYMYLYIPALLLCSTTIHIMLFYHAYA